MCHLTIPIASRSYTYDKRGNNTALTIKDTLKPEQDGTWEYRYDTRNRLTEILFDGKQTVRYTYDPYGNRTLKEENGKTTAYTYDKADRLTEKKEDSDTYTYTYDKKGSLTAITKNGQFHEAYTYDANGNRIRKEENHQTTTYRYDPLNHRMKKTVLIKHPHQNETTSETTYRHDPTARIHTLREITKDKKTTAVTFTENGDLETTTKDGTTCTYITDQNGTPLYTITGDGNLISLPSRGPFGERQEKNKTKTPAHPHTEEETTLPISYGNVIKIRKIEYL